jgi:hypothetical protein
MCAVKLCHRAIFLGCDLNVFCLILLVIFIFKNEPKTTNVYMIDVNLLAIKFTFLETFILSS